MARAATLLAFFVGAALGTVFLSSVLPAASVLVAAAGLTFFYALRDLVRSERRDRRAVGVLAWVVIVLAYALWTYLALAWGSMLWWAVRPWGWALVATTGAAALFTSRPSWNGARVPPAVPLGLCVALSLRGWLAEEQIARCDDYLTLRRESRAELLVATSTELEACTAGREIVIGRFPRIVWQLADGERLLVTTQAASGMPSLEGARFTGSVCEVRADAPPVCVGEGKAQGIADVESLDRIFVASWGRFDSETRGQLLALPRSGGIEVLETLPITGSLGELFHDPAADRLYGITDEGGEVIPIVASTLSLEPAVPAALFGTGAIRYDSTRGEGLLCTSGGPTNRLDDLPFMAVAVRGNPLSLRALGGSSPLTMLTLTWGCDWDPETRLAYVAIPNLGLLATIDYDSGEVRRTDYIGFGIRSVTLDAARGRLYLGSFLGGYVSAIDLATASEVARWEVGRFPRMTTLSRDGSSLFVGTNLGVVSIHLDGDSSTAPGAP